MWNSNGVTVAGGNGPGSAANQLYYPKGIAVSPSGDLYVADGGNNRIQFWSVGATQGE
jgi:DNA-binding beta-propeller fold protein YncE